MDSHDTRERLNPNAVIALLGGLLGCFPPLALLGILAGILAIRQIDASPVPQRGRKLAFAGFILSWITLAIGTVFLIYVLSHPVPRHG